MNFTKCIENETFSQERALYGSENVKLTNCRFEGPEDGESALKESKILAVENCVFKLRYPLWHVENAAIYGSEMTETCRAAIWYSKNMAITASKLFGIKVLRECENVALCDCEIVSPEFCWNCSNVSAGDSSIKTEYGFMGSSGIVLKNVKFSGKYSFQYTENVTIRDSELDTKDAFWHAKNVTVENSVIKGEYLGWYSEGLTLKNCRIIGTQPLCYAKKLKLIDCTMENCDLAFEYSDVTADVRSHIDSVKNPLKGVIVADSIGEIITEGSVKKCRAKITERKNK